MKVKRILLDIKSLDEMAKEFKETWEKASQGKHLPAAKETICFENAEEMHKFLSPARLWLIRTIHEAKPASIYELAKILGRDRKNVTEDVKMLEEIGLIKRKVAKRKKEKVELVVDYDRIQMEIAV
jgi:predicted transcriptional regulator